jgi:hypothetical protein
MRFLEKSLFAAHNVFGAITEESELRGFASTPMQIAQIIAIGLEYWINGILE